MGWLMDYDPSSSSSWGNQVSKRRKVWSCSKLMTHDWKINDLVGIGTSWKQNKLLNLDFILLSSTLTKESTFCTEKNQNFSRVFGHMCECVCVLVCVSVSEYGVYVCVCVYEGETPKTQEFQLAEQKCASPVSIHTHWWYLNCLLELTKYFKIYHFRLSPLTHFQKM